MRPLISLRPLRRSHIGSTTLAFQQIRHFHPTKPRPLVGEILAVSSSAIHGIHWVTGLPWVLSLPLTAALVRLSVAMPLQIFTKKQARKERDIAPILQSWKLLFIKGAERGTYVPDGFDLQQATLNPQQAARKAMLEVRSRQRQLKKRFGVHPFWKAANFLQLPVWLAVMESVRNMCGDNRGLLRYLGSLFEAPKQVHQAVGPVAEPSLATEGALWFPDLLAGDPTGVLPVLLTASIIANVRIGWKSPSPKEIAELPRPELILQSSVLGLKYGIYSLAVYIGYSASFGMPAALMVYWLTSTNLATLQTYFLDKYLLSERLLKVWKPINVAYSKEALNSATNK